MTPPLRSFLLPPSKFDGAHREKVGTHNGRRKQTSMKILSFYEVDPNTAEGLKTHFPAHRARLDDFYARGLLIAAGPLGNSPTGAMAIFPSKEGAEEFIAGDPFVTNGLVSSRRLVEWGAAFL
jgi:uncharacterized protein